MTAVPSFTRKQLEFTILGLILALGLFLRLDNLHNVQRWTGDQSYFYTMLMNWFHDGDWPLLGVYRSIHGDRSLGPGFYYLLAPAMWLGRCGPSAGAVTIVFLSVGAIFLYWFWIRRTTGSALAALTTAALFACSESWVATDRVLWNPNTIPYSVAALACLIEGMRRRPVPCLALFLMLAAVMPQWHTTGIPVLAAAAFPAAWALWQGWAGLRAASRRAWLGWGAALAMVLVALYLPPIIYEFKPGVPSNLRHYIENSFLPAPPQRPPLTERVAAASRRVVKMVVGQNFVSRLRPSREPAARLIAAAALLLFAAVGGGDLVAPGPRGAALGPFSGLRRGGVLAHRDPGRPEGAGLLLLSDAGRPGDAAGMDGGEPAALGSPPLRAALDRPRLGGAADHRGAHRGGNSTARRLGGAPGARFLRVELP